MTKEKGGIKIIIMILLILVLSLLAFIYSSLKIAHDCDEKIKNMQ